MGVWYYLVNDTKKQRIGGNYGKWDEFDPEEEWHEAVAGVEGWSERDTYRWVSDEGDFIRLPLKKPSPWKDCNRFWKGEITEEEFLAKWPKYDTEGVEYWLEISEIDENDEDWYDRILDEETGYEFVSITREPEPVPSEPREPEPVPSEPREPEPVPSEPQPEPVPSEPREPAALPQCAAMCKNGKQCSRSISKKSPVKTMCTQHGNLKIKG